jgi:hypothetical protein
METQRSTRRLLCYHHLPRPIDHIYIHNALNEIGKTRFPESWGMGPAWGPRAFMMTPRLKSGEKKIITFELDRTKNQFKRISRAISAGDTEKGKANSKLLAAMISLLGAITSGAVKAYHMTIGDKPAQIPPKSMHWVKRRMQILHTGYVLADRGDGKLNFVEVLLSRSDFERWLNKDCSEKVSSSKFSVLSDDLIEAWLTIFRDASAQHSNLRFSEERLWQLVKEDLRPDLRLQKATFEKKIFQQLPESARQTVGAGHKRDRETFNAIRPRLASDLKEAAQRLQTPPSTIEPAADR